MKILRLLLTISAIAAIIVNLSGLVLAQPCATCPDSGSQVQSEAKDFDDASWEAYLQHRSASEDWRAGRWEQAVAQYRSIIKNYPSSPHAGSAHMKVGLYLKYQTQYDEALQEFQKGISMIPGTREAEDAKTSIACIHTFRGNHEEALRLLKEVLSNTQDWDQVKYCNYWIKKVERLKNSKGRLSWCGPKALALIFKAKGMKVSEEELTKTLSAKGSQASMEELRNAAVSKGLEAQGLRVKVDQLNKVEFPVIALVKPGHYIVIVSSDLKGYKMVDPEKGDQAVTIYKEALEKDWMGYILSFGKKDDLIKKGFPILTLAEMKSAHGGGCPCCPSGGEFGGCEDNPNIVFDTIDQPLKGCNSSGMPRLLIHTYYLNWVVEDTDFSYSGLSPKVEIKRTYNADDPRESAFGRSWTFNYNVSVNDAGNGYVNLRRGSGKLESFSPAGNGTFHPPTHVYDKLIKNSDGTYSLWVKKDRVTQNFDSDGILTSIVDKNGNAVTFQHEAINPPLIWGTQGTGNRQFQNPMAIAVDSSGNVYVADTNNHRIQKFDSNGGYITQWGSPSGNGTMYPYGIAVDSLGYVYVTDEPNSRVQKYDSNGNYITQWGSGHLTSPWGIAVDQDSSGNIYVYVTDVATAKNNIQKFDSNGNYITSWHCWGSCGGYDVLSTPEGVAVDPSSHAVYVSNTAYNRIVKFDSNGNYLTQWGGFNAVRDTPGQFYFPVQLAVDSSGYVYVADSRNNRIQKFDGSGNFITQWGIYSQYYGDFAFFFPYGIAVDQSGHVYVADTSNNRIKKFLSDLPAGIFLTTITDAAGRVTTLGYDQNYKITSITDPIGRQATFTYDTFGNLISQTDMAGIITSYTYDSSSYMTSITTPRGTTQIAQGFSDVVITDPLGKQRVYRYNSMYDAVFITDARNNQTGYYYDTTSYCGTTRVQSAVGSPIGYNTTFHYGSNCNRTSIINGNGKTASFTYDSSGNITSTTDFLNKTTNYTYDADSNLTQVKDPLNHIFSFGYDTHDNLTGITDPLNKITNLYYNSLGQLTSIIDARQKTTFFTYDSHGNLYSMTDPLSHTSTYNHDGVGHLTSMIDALNHTTQYQYDPLDRITQITHPDGKTSQYGYTCCGLSSMTDENNNVTSYEYDADNRLTFMTDAINGLTQHQYDPNGNLITLTDPKGQVTQFGYDAVNRINSMTYPEGTTEQYTYDNVGKRLTKTDGKTVVTTYQYDDNSRLTGVTAPNIAITYGYDDAGNRTSMTDGIGATTFNYDALNRLDNVIYPGNRTIDYAYDDVGNQTGITTAFGTVSYSYDDANQLSNITLPNLNTINYQYDNAGNLSRIDYPNSTYATYGYDTRNRLTALNNNNPAGIISQYAFTLDGIGNRTNISLQEPLTPVPNPVPIDYSYSTGNLLNNANGTTYGYDNNGNLTSKTNSGNTTNYTYDSLNRLTGLTNPSNSFSYQYDGLNNRVSKIVNGATTNYLVDPNGYLPQVVEELDSGGNITSYYVHDRIGVIAKVTSSGNTYFYHYNGLGSTITMTDSNGNMANKYSYDEFGNVLSQQEAISNPFKYVGRFGVMDEGNGLLYMRARYYDPGVGRFINKDPIGYIGGDLNLFSYARNNPVNHIDPLGLYIGQFPPAPPGYDPTSWTTYQWDCGRWMIKSPEGRIYTVHPEDTGHWRHWDIQGPGGKDEGSWPSNPDKPWPGQKKKLKPNQCNVDPSGDAPGWTPPVILFFAWPSFGVPLIGFESIPIFSPAFVF